MHQPFVAHHVPYVDEATRLAMLDDLRACIRDLDSRPVLQMPDLDDYDATFAPKGIGP